MNNIAAVFNNKHTAYPAFFLGGYVLSYVVNTIRLIAFKNLDLRVTKDPETWVDPKACSRENMKLQKAAAQSNGINIEHQLGLYYLDYCVIIPFYEEIVFRQLLQSTFFLRFPDLAAKSTRLGVSSILFAALHILNHNSKRMMTAGFLSTLTLGVICSIAREKFGLLAAILIHAGFNSFALNQCTYTRKVRIVTCLSQSIKSYHIGLLIRPFFVAFSNIITCFWQYRARFLKNETHLH